MRAAKAIADHFNSIPNVTKVGKLEGVAMAVSPGFWRETLGELGLMKEKGPGRGSVQMKVPIRGARRSRTPARQESRLEASGGGVGHVTPKNESRLESGGEDE